MSRAVLTKQKREAFYEVVDALKFASRRIDGRNGASVYERRELEPAYGELRSSLDRALVWAEEMAWIIERELS